ncbi:MAG TPA: tRNA preQ1(34) S-adenosylmethionine ribosyltransferase-isomerase QueA [Alphaproteobacteria bacterium]
MKPSDFDYHLPDELIAAHPVHPREAARLLTWPLSGDDLTFADLPNLLDPGDLLVVNNSRVIPARLKCTRPSDTQQHEALQTEILLHRPVGDFQTWEIFAQKTKRLKEGQHLHFADNMTAEILERRDNTLVIRFNASAAETEDFIERNGEMPLPPYIPRDEVDTHDKEDYQTIYAKDKGSVAAPTAGLHFSEKLMADLKARGVEVAQVTLHVGAGTFQPMYAHLESIHDHKMHSEFGIVDAATVEQIKATKARGNKVIPVGTTSLRLLESAARDGELKPFSGDTDIFITPGFTFNVADRLITNFHLPQSTLLILVSAFIGFENMQTLYAHAITEKFRFYSYGDGCLLDRSP